MSHPTQSSQDRPATRTSWIPWVGLVATIGLQILWPLSSGQPRIALTITTVIVFAATSVSHAWVTHGAGWAMAYLGITFGFAFALEAVGTNSGFPFGAYEYGDMLGVRVTDVPLLIPLAWAMTAYPVLLLSRRIAQSFTSAGVIRYVATTAVGAFAMTTWDLFLDPQMVSQDYWVWRDPSPALPGIEGIPAGNYLGWLVGSAILIALLNSLPTRIADERVPAALWTWTWVGGIISNAFFFGRPSVAVVGGIAMGLVTVPYLYLLTRDRRTPTSSQAADQPLAQVDQ